MTKYWLIKSEPNVYSIDDLQQDKITFWDGVRNYQARNFIRDEIKKNDLVLFYHSNTKPPGVIGIAQVVKEGYPDISALDPKNAYFDASSKEDKPIWYGVDIKFVEKFKKMISLEEIKNTPSLKDMVLLKRSRLSIQPVKKQEFQTIVKLASVWKTK